MNSRLSWLVSTGLFLPLVLARCGGDSIPDAKPPPVEVGVLAMHAQDVPLTRDLVGRISALRSADVRARVAGVLEKRSYEEGSDVKKGDVLFEIDPAPLKASLDAARAGLAQSLASHRNAQVAAGRVRELAPKGFVSKSDVDNAEATERTTGAAVKQAEANAESARINLGYATVRAPIAGRAGKQQVTEGALVGEGAATLLTTIDQIDPVYVNFGIGVDDLERLRRAQASGGVSLTGTDQTTVRLSFSDGTVYGPTGTLDFSDTTVDPATGAVTLRASIPNPDHTLLPGMYVTIKATLGKRHSVFLVPQAALQRDTIGPYVLTVGSDNKVYRKSVKTDVVHEAFWIVEDGLSEGDRVIVSGTQKAHVDDIVRPLAWKPSTDDTPPVKVEDK